MSRGAEFEEGREKVLFFCRGRGSGHAIPDMEVAKELAEVRPQAEIRFVSYGTGARTLAEHRHKVIDIGLPELNSLFDVMVIATKLVGAFDPDVVMAHEEFGALPAAKVFDKPALFLTDWFVEEDRIIMGALRYADHVLFADWEGGFEEPAQARGRTEYVGPVFRRFDWSTADRERARAELELPRDATVVSVLPGGYATEEKAPIADLVLEAFEKLDAPQKRLVWVAADDDLEALTERTAKMDDVRVMSREWRIDRLMAASDAAVTKANRKTVLELEALGVRSVALSAELNPIDDMWARACEGVEFRVLRDVSATDLAEVLAQQISRGLRDAMDLTDLRAARTVAERLGEFCQAATG